MASVNLRSLNEIVADTTRWRRTLPRSPETGALIKNLNHR